MTEPDSTGIPDDRPKSSPKEGGFALPSWVDAAITRSSKDDEQGADEQDTAPLEAVPADQASESPALIPGVLTARAPAELVPEPATKISPMPEMPPEPEPVSSAAPAAEPVHEAPPVRKGLALPWLLAAFLFAAAALVLAFLIWFKPAR